MRQRKLPEPKEVERLYWMEEKNLQQIAEQFGVKRSSVCLYMQYHKIPRRKTGLRPAGQCVTCGDLCCRTKKMHPRTRQYRWAFSWYCALHYLKRIRKRQRQYMWRRRGHSSVAGNRKGKLKQTFQETAWLKLS